MIIHSHAKLNWHLEVLNRRPDGFHEIISVMQELELADMLEVSPADAGGCLVEGLPPEVPPDDNLIVRAWNLLRDECGEGVGGIRVRIDKHIPAGGGLGGGSSNAAATLKAIRELFGLQLSDAELTVLGARLGSDVPFFVGGGCALVRGRGEIVEPVAGIPSLEIVLAFPQARVSTPAAYAALGRGMEPVATQGPATLLKALAEGDAALVAPLIRSDFEMLFRGEEWFQAASKTLTDAGASRVFLCGSGSTVAGLISGRTGQGSKNNSYNFERVVGLDSGREPMQALVMKTRTVGSEVG